jgi:hypothetical protein
VRRLLPCEIYEGNHSQDRQAQLAQMRLLVNATTGRIHVAHGSQLIKNKEAS